MRKIYTKELGPKPVPLTVLGEAVAEEDVSSMTNSYWVLNIARPEDDLSLDNIPTSYMNPELCF
jgi:hypothetical protein